MPLDVYLVELGGELQGDPFATLEAGKGGYIPKGANEFVSIICLPHDIGGLAMAIARDDLLADIEERKELQLPELDELYAGDEVQPEGFQIGWRVFRNRSLRLPLVVSYEGSDMEVELSHRID